MEGMKVLVGPLRESKGLKLVEKENKVNKPLT